MRFFYTVSSKNDFKSSRTYWNKFFVIMFLVLIFVYLCVCLYLFVYSFGFLSIYERENRFVGVKFYFISMSIKMINS